MFSDTHFHYTTMTLDRGVDGIQVLSELGERDCHFALDIGTKSDDLLFHQSNIEKSIASISDVKLADKVRRFMYFSAGIWPDVGAILDRKNQIEILRNQIQQTWNSTDSDILNRKIVAVGECGLDHHWNPAGTDGRCEEDFDKSVYDGEREMFEMQIDLARSLNLPVIVHSRDAFSETLDCIKNSGYNNGIIHCYSYGIKEAEEFLKLGWYISFSGSVTYTKKAKMQEMHELLNLVPEDKLLCETDSPYLAPVPFRGQPCSPVLVQHTYNFVAEHRGVTPENLSKTVDKNIDRLFFLKS